MGRRRALDRTTRKGLSHATGAAVAALLLAVGLPSLADTAGDDFDDNQKDPSKWGADLVTGHGIMNEVRHWMEYTCSNPTPEWDALDWPWVLRSLPYGSDWEVEIEVWNETTPTQSDQVNSFGLNLPNPHDSNDSIYVELYASALGGGPAHFGFTGQLEENGNLASTGLVDSGDLGVRVGAVRLTYVASEKVVHTYYDADITNGHQWTELSSYGIAGAGGANGNSDWQMTDSDHFPLTVYGYSEHMVVHTSEIWGDNFLETGGVAPPQQHDLAVTKIKQPKSITLDETHPSFTKRVDVTIQNRSAHDETIESLEGLVTLEIDSLGLTCPDPVATLHEGAPNKTLPFILRSRRSMKVAFDATFDCANDPQKGEGFEDYSYSATVHHDAIDSEVDTHPVDDSCPRSVTPPYEIDPNPDAKIKDKGCGAKKLDKTLGDPVTTDLLVK